MGFLCPKHAQVDYAVCLFFFGGEDKRTKRGKFVQDAKAMVQQHRADAAEQTACTHCLLGSSLSKEHLSLAYKALSIETWGLRSKHIKSPGLPFAKRKSSVS